MKVHVSLVWFAVLAIALSTGSCRRAVEKSARKVRFEGIERIERRGLTGAEVVVRVDNGSAHRLTLSSAEFDIYCAESCVGSLVLEEPVEVERRTAASLVTRWRLRIADPLALLVLTRRISAGEYDRIAVSCALEGRGGPAPVKFSREKMPLSDFLNTFGLSIQDLEKQLK